MKTNYMKTAAFCLTLAFSFSAQNTFAADTEKDTAAKEAAPKLEIGDPVPALEGVTWVQGNEIKSFDEKGKVYMIECWATWCGPCIAAIPHVNDLHKKFADKGLVVVGMNVWEDGLDKVKGFVEKQGDGMSYRVAYSGGRSSTFADTWLKPAGVSGIPRALLIKDGKLVLNTHPSQIDEELIESVIAGSFNAEEYAKEQEAKKAKREAERDAVRKLMQNKDWDGLIAFANEMEDDETMKGVYLSRANIQKGDWAAMLALRGKAAESFGRFEPSHIDGQVVMMMEAGEGAKAYAEAALAAMPKEAEKGRAAVEQSFQKARFLFITGDAEGAKSSLEEANAALKEANNPRLSQYYGKILDGATKSLEDGKFPSTMKLMGR